MSPRFIRRSSAPSLRAPAAFVPLAVSLTHLSISIPFPSQNRPISYRWFSTVCLSVLTRMYA